MKLEEYKILRPQNLLNFLYKPYSFLYLSTTTVFLPVSFISIENTAACLVLSHEPPLEIHRRPVTARIKKKNKQHLSFKVLCTTLSAHQFRPLTSSCWTCPLRGLKMLVENLNASSSWYLNGAASFSIHSEESCVSITCEKT